MPVGDCMGAIIKAMSGALRDLREPRVLAVGLLPPLAAVLVWVAAAWAIADDWARWVADGIATTSWSRTESRPRRG